MQNYLIDNFLITQYIILKYIIFIVYSNCGLFDKILKVYYTKNTTECTKNEGG